MLLGNLRGFDKPLALEEGSKNSIAHGWYPIGSHQVDISLSAGETRVIIFVLGYAQNKDEKWAGNNIINKEEAKDFSVSSSPMML